MKILYIASLITKKERFDGERIKSSYIFNSLSKLFKVTVINLSKFKLFNTIRFVFLSLKRNKWEYIVVSKDSHGANTIHKILKITKFPSDKIVYFQIGSFLYDGILNGTMDKTLFENIKLLIVETETMKKELESIGFKNVDVYPNFKPVYDIEFNYHKYPKDILNLVYFSRIENEKGIYDLIECISEINNEKYRFELDVYGRPQTDEDKIRILELEQEHNFLHYKGKLEIKNDETYKFLSKYDLHTFPTFFHSEGFPGTVIDFFIAGVPTLSSSFINSEDIFRPDDSFIFKMKDWSDLKDKLIFIYNNQNLLNKARLNTYKRRTDFSIEKFEEYLCKIFIGRES